MTVRVVRPGLLTTVQDLGRWGWQRYGVAVGGAMDRRSLRIANLLVGNPQNTAALEMTVQGPRLYFEREAVVALSGAEMTATVDRHAIPMGKSIYLPANSVLDCGTAIRGCRAYLAISGGFDVPVVLDSRSTYIAAEIGGVAGRALRSGDILESGTIERAAQSALAKLRRTENQRAPSFEMWGAASRLPVADAVNVVRVVRGSEFDRLSADSRHAFLHGEFEITAKSDRMGYRLAGPAMHSTDPAELISEGVVTGTIQLPPDGQLIMLMADCATTGGYPKVAHVVSVDRSLLAQSGPGTKIRFEETTLEDAHRWHRADEIDMNRLRVGIELKFAQL